MLEIIYTALINSSMDLSGVSLLENSPSSLVENVSSNQPLKISKLTDIHQNIRYISLETGDAEEDPNADSGDGDDDLNDRIWTSEDKDDRDDDDDLNDRIWGEENRRDNSRDNDHRLESGDAEEDPNANDEDDNDDDLNDRIWGSQDRDRNDDDDDDDLDDRIWGEDRRSNRKDRFDYPVWDSNWRWNRQQRRYERIQERRRPLSSDE